MVLGSRELVPTPLCMLKFRDAQVSIHIKCHSTIGSFYSWVLPLWVQPTQIESQDMEPADRNILGPPCVFQFFDAVVNGLTLIFSSLY